MRELMIGNYAIARGLVEAKVEIAAAYPGTPSSEILPGIIEFAKRENLDVHCEWSVNEKVAFEAAFGAALYGKKAACMMKQVGLNVAFPSFFESLEREIRGGLLLVSCDDPGPLSSQTEQDTRMVCSLLGVTVLDPSSPSEAADCAYYGLLLSKKLGKPVVLRPTHRVSHSREAVRLYHLGKRKVRLKEGLVGKGSFKGFGIVASGTSYSVVMDVLSELGLKRDIPVFKVIKVHPLNDKVFQFRDSLERVIVFEETDAVIEARLNLKGKVYGRLNGILPDAGELSYDIIRKAVIEMCHLSGLKVKYEEEREVDEVLGKIHLPLRPPKLCSGCPHRATFYAMKRACPDAIFPGDIGCYTLGISLGAVDVFVDMGGSVNLASGFDSVFKKEGRDIPILASVGDSTFFHACLPEIYDAARKKRKFVLVIMDNNITAMTGMQPTPQTGLTADGKRTNSISLEATLSALGVKNVKVVDPYEIPTLVETIKNSLSNFEAEDGPFVIIARRECLLHKKKKWERDIELDEICTGCKRCLKDFDCPSMEFDEDKKRIRINRDLCVGCGCCLFVCPQFSKTKKKVE